jgi:drug/metabolite transporter (DMT)-like permease
MSRKYNNKLAIQYAIGAVLIWSTVATVFKLTLRQIDAAGLVWWSMITSFIVLGAWIVIGGKKDKVGHYLRGSWQKSLLLGAINPFVYYLALFKAYELLPAQEAQAINYTWALVLAFLSVLLLEHKLNKYDVIAAIMGYAGVLIIATHGNLYDLHFESFYGVGLALVSTILWALYWILNTKISSDTVVVLFVNFGFGLLFMSAYLLWRGNWPSIASFGTVLGVIYIGMFEMSITFVLWGRALRLTDKVGRISNLIFISPILSLVFIYIFVGEKIYGSTVVALILILAGLALQRKKQ